MKDDLFAKSSNYKSFPYSLNQVCNIRQIGFSTYVFVEDAYSLQRSAAIKLHLFNRDGKIADPLACFHFNGYSYLFYKFKENDPTISSNIHIMRGRIEQSFTLQINYKLFSFDHFYSRLYFISKDNLLYQFDLPILDSFWPFNENLRKNSTTDILYTNVVDLKNNTINDLIVFNNVFYISDSNGTLWRKNNTELASQLPTPLPTNINLLNKFSKFQFIFFLPYQKLYSLFRQQYEYPTNVALSSIASSLTFSLPPPPKVDNNGILTYLLHLLNIFIILLLIYLCKIKLGDSNKNNDFKNNDVYFELVTKPISK